MNKKTGMYSLILWLWALSIAYFDFKLLALLIGKEHLIAKISVAIFVLCLNMFWLYGIYHIIVPVYSNIAKRKLNSVRKNISITEEQPGIALLYTTKNDFNQTAVESCLKQNYKNYRVFICDDSTDEKYINTIDAYAKDYASIITVIRRKNNKGYKAGNINNALKTIKNEFPYFAINDADGILPENFLSGLLPYMLNDAKIAFAQAKQTANPAPETTFAKDLSANINIHWNYYVPAKEEYGFTMFYGHGAVIKTEAWEKAGGLPEIATEDLAFSMKVRELGYYGVFVPEIECYEEFPSSYEKFRRRNEKWVKGTAECLTKHYKTFLFCPKVSWIEKLDVFISAFSLLISVPFAIFLLLVGIVLPVSYGLFKYNGPLVIMPFCIAQSWTTYLMSINYNVYWTWDLLWIMALMILGPQLASVMTLYKTPVKMLRYIAYSTFLYLSLIAVSNINFFTYIFTGKAHFPVTGEAKQHKTALNFLNSNSKTVSIIELIIGLCLIIYTIKNVNIWLLSTAVALCTAPFVRKKYWDSIIAREILYIPFVVTITITVLIAYSLTGAGI